MKEPPDSGLSPRVRGNPALTRVRRPFFKVYPRAYGGTMSTDASLPRSKGLSPRVRGNHMRASACTGAQRSIPARTGEPDCPCCEGSGEQVYPRAYGGTVVLPLFRGLVEGLSPRVRGNLQRVFRALQMARSIPARTGEPLTPGRRERRPGVYPRAYGGTQAAEARPREVEGLSPRVRGNPQSGMRATTLLGSIPARTGEPGHPARGCKSRPVYPRAYGGTGACKA